MVHVGDAVGRGHDAPLQGLGAQVPRVVQDAVAHFRGEVQSRAAVLDALHHPYRLLVVAVQTLRLRACRVDAPMACECPGKGRLARVPKGGVAQVVTEGDGLGEVLVQPECPRDGARDLRHFQGVGKPRAEVVALGCEEHLGLVGEPPKRL